MSFPISLFSLGLLRDMLWYMWFLFFPALEVRYFEKFFRFFPVYSGNCKLDAKKLSLSHEPRYSYTYRHRFLRNFFIFLSVPNNYSYWVGVSLKDSIRSVTRTQQFTILRNLTPLFSPMQLYCT